MVIITYSRFLFSALFLFFTIALFFYKFIGVSVASVHPGVVDTEGLWEHAQLARAAELPHAAYFDRLKEEGGMLDPAQVAKFLRFLLQDTNEEEYSAKEWHIKDETHWKRWKE